MTIRLVLMQLIDAESRVAYFWARTEEMEKRWGEKPEGCTRDNVQALIVLFIRCERGFPPFFEHMNPGHWWTQHASDWSPTKNDWNSIETENTNYRAVIRGRRWDPLHLADHFRSHREKSSLFSLPRVNQIDLGMRNGQFPYVRNESSSGTWHAAARNLDKRRRLFVFRPFRSRPRSLSLPLSPQHGRIVRYL